MKGSNFVVLSRIKTFVVPLFVILFVALSLSVALDEVKKNQDVRIKASGSRIARDIFCEGKDMCPDGRCVGEVWRECEPCPTGKARAVYRISCDLDSYSECTLDDKVCDD